MPPRYKPSKTAAFFRDLQSKLDPTKLFARKRLPPRPRSIYVNLPLPAESFDKKGKVPKADHYSCNQVLTSKYSIVTFIPKNLFEQFRRIANIFFLGIAILQFFPKFSTISPGLVILPLLAVLFITGAKDGYEDYKRHQSDKRVNHSVAHVLHGGAHFNVNPMTTKAKTFVKGVSLPQSKKRREAKRREQAGWGKIIRDENTDTDSVHHRAAASTFPGEDLRGIRTREEEVEAGVMPGTADEDPEAGVDPEHPNEPGWKTTMWEDVKVGDFVKIYNNEGLPADIVICSTSEEEDVAYVETKNLDGETNLKSRHAVPELAHLRSALSCSTAQFKMDCEAAEVNMFRLNAAVVSQEHPGAEETRAPINLETCLLRACVLRNTAWVIGIVVFTGEDSKIVANSGGTPSKRSKVERDMNPQVLLSLCILAIAAMVCAIVDHFNEVVWYRQNAYWTLYDDAPDDNPSFNGLVTFFNSLITFQNIVPISLYISIEFVRTAQAAFIYFDDELWHRQSDTRTLARSWNLTDDMGQIEYIFSDKTGTLTQNAMIFQQCSIAGRIYKGDGKLPDNIVPTQQTDGPGTSGLTDARKDSVDCTAVGEGSPASSDRPLKKSPSTNGGEPSGGSSAEAEGSTTNDNVDTDDAEGTDKAKTTKEPIPPFHDDELLRDLQNTETEQSTNIHGFFATLALCHTVLASRGENGVWNYMAQSPDESALVQAAADVGFVFQGRDRNILRLRTPFNEELDEYELLNVLEFSSARKRMSVLLRKLDDDRRIFLLSKGADNVIFERLAPGKEALKVKTNKDLEQFANEGLRTLCLGYRIVPEEEFEAWSRDFHEATVSLEDREELMASVAAKIEHSLILLGSTAIEDKLQDGVPEAIADLKRAGIKVWVATGDKLETAIAIGYSTNLLSRDSNLVIIRGGAYGTPNSAYDQMRSAIIEFFGKEVVEDVNYHPPELERTASRPSLFSRTSNIGRRPSFNLRRTVSGVSDIVGEGNGERSGGFSLVIEGSALTHAFEEEWTEDLLLQLSTRCKTVIACRVSPLQKAQIVHMIKDNLGVMTLAIGDGANDVSMIQAADVGIGISGEEGLQAVNSSDYAIAQFRYLKRLLLVHGHWSYVRNSNMILNFFYKNMIGVAVLFFFQIYCAWSSTYVFEYVYLLLWNVVWSIAPVIAMGVFDRDLDDDILMDLPELYAAGIGGKFFGMRQYLYFIGEGVLQSAVIFFFINQTYDVTTARQDGYDVFMYEFSTAMVIGAVMVCNEFHGITTHAWTGWVWFAVLIGPILVWAFTAVYSALPPNVLITNVYGNYDFLFTSALFWFSVIFVSIVALLPRYLLQVVQSVYFPSDIEVMKFIRKANPTLDIAHHPALGAHGLSNEKGPLLEEHHPGRKSNSAATAEEHMEQGDEPRPSMTSLRRLQRTGTGLGSQIDMSTGMRTPVSEQRGFGFAGEDNGGVAGIMRTQSRLSTVSRPQTRAEELRTGAGGSRKRSGTLTNLRARAGSVFTSKNKRRDSVVSRDSAAAGAPPSPPASVPAAGQVETVKSKPAVEQPPPWTPPSNPSHDP